MGADHISTQEGRHIKHLLLLSHFNDIQNVGKF